MRALVAVAVMVGLIGGSVGLASAETFSADLPGLIGYHVNQWQGSTAFNVQKSFSSISAVRLVLDAYQQGCMELDSDGKMHPNTTTSKFDVRDQMGTVLATGPTFTIMPPSSIGGSYTIAPPPGGWDCLLTGMGSISYRFGPTSMYGGFDGYIDVNAARVEIDGTPVPEPATLSLLALGGLLIARRRWA